ncbi:hypothetical protein Taro_056322 [Colocasia esculenta]|uniref:Uncharacterized protein n=1 Tax=Colocasia esculenta TaxID=4460 RepID=A0A843XTL0_COLES|nr:hypothetical protein [Colocasia esculenta]
MCDVNVWLKQVKSRVGPEMKHDLLLFSWSWWTGVAVDWLASRLVDVHCLNLAAVDVDAKGGGYRLTREQLSQLTLFPLLPQLRAPVFLKLLTGSEEWLDDRRTRGVDELCEETSRRGAISVGARGGLGVNREIAGSSSGLWPENLASTSFVAKLLSQDVNGQVRARRTFLVRRPVQGRVVAVQGQYLQRSSSRCVVLQQCTVYFL